MCAMGTMSGRESLQQLYALSPAEIDLLPWEPVPGCPGVQEKVLWQLAGFTQALIRYQPGSSSAGEPHLAAHHHIYVLAGAATIAGRRMLAGSYLRVPPGVRHPIEEVGPEGCTLLQMHRPHAFAEAVDYAAGG